MKICVTSQGDHLDSPVDPRFGRAAYFLFVDPDSMEFEAFENPSVSVGGGAGISAAKQVIDAGASAALTGNCGPKAFAVLQAANIQVYTGLSGTVRQAVEAFQSGVLTADRQANSEAHGGMEYQI